MENTKSYGLNITRGDRERQTEERTVKRKRSYDLVALKNSQPLKKLKIKRRLLRKTKSKAPPEKPNLKGKVRLSNSW